MSKPHKNNVTWRGAGFFIWLCLWPTLFAIHHYPIRDLASRSALCGIPILLWLGSVWLTHRFVLGKVLLLGVPVALLLLAVLPGRKGDGHVLRLAYVRALGEYEGTPYVWGGENHHGIDCSGLVRAGLVDAELRTGWSTLNPALVRRALDMWWHDCTAAQLKAGYREQALPLFEARNLNSLNKSALEPGDFAVTANGVHTLAYLGNGTWIEADPNALTGDKVICVRAPTANAWFITPVELMRWRALH